MQFTTALVVAFAAFAAAQDTSDLPTCSQGCATNATAISDAGCSSSTDFTCLCASAVFNAYEFECVEASCADLADVAATLDWANTTCISVGIPIEIPGSSKKLF